MSYVNTWYGSDFHLGHANILRYQADTRPWANTEEMRHAMADEWNKWVKPTDKVIYAGDLAFGRDNIQYIELFNGIKTLVMGNHEYGADEYIKYFKRVCGVHEAKGNVVVTHIPVHPSQFGRYRANVHGHLHSHVLDDPRYINICMDHIGLRPMNHDELMEKVKKLPNPRDK